MDDQGSSWTSPTKSVPWPPPRHRVSELRKKFERSPKKKYHPQEERYNQDQFQNQEEIQYQEDGYNQEENDWQRYIDDYQNDFDPNERYSNQDAYHESYRDEFQEPSFANVSEFKTTGYHEGRSHTGHKESPINESSDEEVRSPRARIPHHSKVPGLIYSTDEESSDEQEIRRRKNDPSRRHDPGHLALIYSSDEEEELAKEEANRRYRELFRKFYPNDDTTFPESVQRRETPDYPPEDHLESQDKPVPGSSSRRASQNNGAGNVTEVPPQPAIERRGLLGSPDENLWRGIRDMKDSVLQPKRLQKPKKYIEFAFEKGFLYPPTIKFIIRLGVPLIQPTINILPPVNKN
ncbi:hypothetical protein JTE90_003293 [Oedothorax gibbosus]|uniref:Uncharacterized protein n=1 Tax=Oedothorax gibbosus TaxID=931172 RepID=A0AAV6V464_9ARAC|nr:hypothetical protein JTE90_003293 [Oedothorax gibbosus]